jgi:2-(1,2-epoxy-1,2-dihydrophenyl)acetyl-CoA isomerase
VIAVHRGDAWLEIRLDRPERLNALCAEMQSQLLQALSDAQADPACRAILVTGTGGAFCAGQNLEDRDPRKYEVPPDLHRSVSTLYNPLIRALRAGPKPVVCALNGIAAGAGVGIALACDLIVASEDARFLLAFSRIGLCPDSGVSWFLTRNLGEMRAKALALTAGSLSAEEAHAAGLVHQVCPADEFDAVARDLVARIAAGPTFALSLTRQAIHAASANELNAQLDLEAELQGRAGCAPDYAEGVLAFLEKRKPRFSGNSAATQHDQSSE